MDGREDVERAEAELARRLPSELEPLARLAYDLRWSWTPGGAELFAALDARAWARSRNNAVHLLRTLSEARLEEAAADERLTGALRDLVAALAAPQPQPGGETIAYLCAEYAVHVSLPVYSGGLGALAGDVLKEASDQGVPLVAVGLLYRQGYFRQHVDAGGRQHEHWEVVDPEDLPLVRVTRNGAPLQISVPIAGRDVRAEIWRAEVGRVPMYLLDTDVEGNDPVARWISQRLYVADQRVRLAQYVLLGVGGMRALTAMGIEPGVVHLNEGHAAFAALELGLDPERLVFTTHTPVPAGNDTFPPEMVLETVGAAAEAAGVSGEELLRLGRTWPDEPGEPFGVSQLALRTSRAANAVSRRHGEVARDMWQALWPGRPPHEVPIGHVTNGVHVPTWIGTPMRALLDGALGEDWVVRAREPDSWAGLDGVSDEELWRVRCEQRAALVRWARERSVRERLGRTEPSEYAMAAADALDDGALTIGFARRVATYKRLDLLLHAADGAIPLLTGDRPVQLFIAGKAHPADEEGKRLLQALFAIRHTPGVGGRVVFVEDYDLAVAARLVQGCDVWLNLPRPPLEASGTSGMKNAVNGGLQLSVLDGWWAEAYDPSLGWALPGDVDHDHGAQDARHAAELQRLLWDEVTPRFFDRGDDGVPRGWTATMRASIRANGPRFSAGRMLADYGGLHRRG